MAQAEPAELFKLLSADTRIAIIELLKHGPLKVNEIAGFLGISPSAISQHLRLLKSAGLVRGKRDGYWIAYSLNNDKLLEYRRKLNELCICGCRRCRESSLTTLKEYQRELEEELERVQREITEVEAK